MCAEVLTGKGALQQLGFETGLPIGDLDGLILGVAAFNVLAALLPAKVGTCGARLCLAQGGGGHCACLASGHPPVHCSRPMFVPRVQGAPG